MEMRLRTMGCRQVSQPGDGTLVKIRRFLSRTASHQEPKRK